MDVRDSGRRENQQLRMRISELESARNALEREFSASKAAAEHQAEQLRQRVATLNEVFFSKK